MLNEQFLQDQQQISHGRKSRYDNENNKQKEERITYEKLVWQMWRKR